MKNLVIAVGVLILAQAYCMMPVHTAAALDWIIFAVLLVFGVYIIYDAMQTAK